MDNVFTSQLVSAPRLLEVIFEQPGRPSLRWLREQQSRRAIPFIKIGRRVFFDPNQVREALSVKFTVTKKTLRSSSPAQG